MGEKLIGVVRNILLLAWGNRTLGVRGRRASVRLKRAMLEAKTCGIATF